MLMEQAVAHSTLCLEEGVQGGKFLCEDSWSKDRIQTILYNE